MIPHSCNPMMSDKRNSTLQPPSSWRCVHHHLFRCDHQGKMLRFSFAFVEDCGTTIGLFVFIDLIDAYKKANFNTWDQDKKTHEFLY